MQFEQATELATRIRQHYPRVEVLAVGRFVPIAELHTQPERWGVSVLIDKQRQTVFWWESAVAIYASIEKPKRSAVNKPSRSSSLQEATLF